MKNQASGVTDKQQPAAKRQLDSFAVNLGFFSNHKESAVPTSRQQKNSMLNNTREFGAKIIKTKLEQRASFYILREGTT